MKLMLLFVLPLGALLASCSSNDGLRPEATDNYPASNPIGAPGATVQESLSDTNYWQE